ncbi:MAG: O-linked N-acetylglucosamine transferase, SPINDLY family protein [Pirellulaceae bacterium]
MESVDAAFLAAMQQHRAGNSARAAEAYERIVRRQPDHAGAWHLLGVVCEENGELERAVEYIRRAISLDETQAAFHNNLGVALRAQGHTPEAEQAYRRALVLDPQYADAYTNLAVVLHDLGMHEESQRCFEQTLQIQPAHADALYNLGNLRCDLGDTTRAISLYRAALAIRPQWASAYNNLANALLAERRAVEAVACYEKAVALDPDHAAAHLNLGTAYAQQDMVEEAARCWQTASQLRPDKPLWKMRSLGLCPVVFQDVSELDDYRCELEAQLDRCLDLPLQLDWRDFVTDAVPPSFNLSHHGRNNRRLKEKFAALYQRHFPTVRRDVRRGRPRIGFLVTRLHEGGFLRCLGGVVERLDAAQFELAVLCSQSILGTCRQAIRREDVLWIPFADRFPAAVERIAAAQCDLLYHWQVGTDPLNYFLPLARLAPVQCTGWGTHATTGISAIDYYLSSKLMEGDTAAEHYTETLYRFPTFPCYVRRVVPAPYTQRRLFALPDRGAIYLCPHRLAKFHPDFDALLAGVLAADPHGHVVVLRGPYERAVELLQARWRRTLGRLLDRVIFLGAQQPASFYRLLSLADVVLDIPHYSAGLIGHDAFSLNIPIVTYPGQFNVGRYTLGYYRRMGIDGLVATTPKQYVTLAVQLGNDREYREAVRLQLAERSDTLFDDEEAVRSHEEFFHRVLRWVTVDAANGSGIFRASFFQISSFFVARRVETWPSGAPV